jgi:hypothetical protein
VSELPLRRILSVLIAYAAGAWLVLLLAGWLGRVLALPPLFATLVRGLAVVGVPVAVLLAWRYPELGAGEDER